MRCCPGYTAEKLCLVWGPSGRCALLSEREDNEQCIGGAKELVVSVPVGSAVASLAPRYMLGAYSVTSADCFDTVAESWIPPGGVCCKVVFCLARCTRLDDCHQFLFSGVESLSWLRNHLGAQGSDVQFLACLLGKVGTCSNSNSQEENNKYEKEGLKAGSAAEGKYGESWFEAEVLEIKPVLRGSEVQVQVKVKWGHDGTEADLDVSDVRQKGSEEQLVNMDMTAFLCSRFSGTMGGSPLRTAFEQSDWRATERAGGSGFLLTRRLCVEEKGKGKGMGLRGDEKGKGKGMGNELECKLVCSAQLPEARTEVFRGFGLEWGTRDACYFQLHTATPGLRHSHEEAIECKGKGKSKDGPKGRGKDGGKSAGTGESWEDFRESWEDFLGKVKSKDGPTGKGKAGSRTAGKGEAAEDFLGKGTSKDRPRGRGREMAARPQATARRRNNF